MVNKLKKIIQEVLSEIMMDEAAVGYEDAARAGLGIVEAYDGGLMALVLHNFSNDKNVGIIYLKKKEDGYEVYGTAAERGYGPLLYRAAMSRVYPSYVYPDRMSVSKAASNVWEKFYNDNSVDKVDTKNIEFHGESHLNKKYRMRGNDFSKLEVSGLGDKEDKRILGFGRDRFEDYLNAEH